MDSVSNQQPSIVRASKYANLREEIALRQRVEGFRFACNHNLTHLNFAQRRLSTSLVQLKSKMVYGRELIYPVCEDSKIICQMLNVKTLNDFHIRKLTALDYRMAFNEEDYLFNCQN